jgi:nitric oxide reductase NorQ protein
MSSSESDSAVDRVEPLVVVSHLVHGRLKREGGSGPLERVTLRGSDYVDIEDPGATDLIDAGAVEGVFALDRGTDGRTTTVGSRRGGRSRP